MTTTATQTYSAGDRVCTVARDGSRCANGYPIWVGGIYEARARKSDGVLTWRRVGCFGDDRSGKRPSAKFELELQSEAEHEWIDGIRHGDKCNQ